MYALIVSRKIRLSHKLFSAAMDRADVIFLAGHVVSQHMLIVVVSSGEALIRAQVAAVLRVGGVGMSSVPGAFPW
jgi:hypothetical protein